MRCKPKYLRFCLFLEKFKKFNLNIVGPYSWNYKKINLGLVKPLVLG